MKMSISDLRDILNVAYASDLDDDLPVECDENKKSLTLYLGEHAWGEFLWCLKLGLVKRE